MVILTHRGLDKDTKNYPAESSYEAFEDQLDRGYGLELDINFSHDKKIFFYHGDKPRDTRARQNKIIFKNLSWDEIKKNGLGKYAFCDFDRMMGMIKSRRQTLHAMHLKGKFQKQEYLDIIIGYLKKYPAQIKNILLFDVKPKTAGYLKKKLPTINLAPSVAHYYDIKRYNTCVGGTLISLQTAINTKNIFNWVWLDEWDKSDKNGKTKKLYTEANFALLRKEGFKISLATPELHATSPDLLGGEMHPDAITKTKLFNRIKEILKLRPDAICTDYPDTVKKLQLR